MDAATFQATFDSMAKQGFGPLIVTATGSGNNPLFAASLFETSRIPLTKFGMTAAESTAQNKAAVKDDLILHYADRYGDPGNPVYVAVWVANTDKLAYDRWEGGPLARRFDGFLHSRP